MIEIAIVAYLLIALALGVAAETEPLMMRMDRERVPRWVSYTVFFVALLTWPLSVAAHYYFKSQQYRGDDDEHR